MEKLDLTRLYKNYYSAKPTPAIVDIEEAKFLSITGKGDPSEKMFADKIEVLYTTAYAIKFISKSSGKDFVVARLEGLWWFDEQKFAGLSILETPVKVPRSEWEYRLLIRLPDFVNTEVVQEGIAATMAKKRLQLAYDIERYSMAEGKSVQMLHVGPFETEPETLQQMNEFMKSNNFVKNGLHHEIYLSDFRKTAPDKLKTILREPVK